MSSGFRVLLSILILLNPAWASATEMFPGDVFSGSAQGSTSANILKLPTSARFEAMGETVSAGAQGVEAMFYNPGGLARLDPYGPADLSLGYINFLDNVDSGSIAYARPGYYGWLGFGVLGAGFIYQSQTAQTRYNSQGDNTGEFRPTDFVFSVSYAKRLGRFRVGANVKMIQTSLDVHTGVAAAMDLGVQVQNVMDFGDAPVDFGASLLNFGSPMKVGTTSFPLPLIVRGGFLWHISKVVSFASDANFPIDGDPYSSIGMEAKFPLGDPRWKAFLRGGYNQNYRRGIDGLAGFSLGLGLDFTKMRVDYAWTPYGDLGRSNRFNLGFKF